VPISAEQKSLVEQQPTPVAGAHGLVAIGASAGGLRALTAVLCALPGDFPAPIAIVQHLDPRYRSLVAQILGRQTPLAVREVVDGMQAQPGTVYVAPPDHHLLIAADGIFSLSQTEVVHFVRPSIDLLFESLATSFRERAVAVILTGSGSDGAAGVLAIKRMGGTVIVQNEESAEFSGMPAAALRAVSVDLVLPLEEIAPALRRVVGERTSR
jgi:two-component system, chemotaxis family, protein-glutamate methylesterase/glutaminase